MVVKVAIFCYRSTSISGCVLGGPESRSTSLDGSSKSTLVRTRFTSGSAYVAPIRIQLGKSLFLLVNWSSL